MGVSSLEGADRMTFLAPASRCFCAVTLSRNRPVDSITTSAPTSFHFRLAGSRSCVRRIFLPLTTRVLPSTETSPLKRPCTESYCSMYARYSGSRRSLMPTTSMSLKFWMAERSTLRPMRPKPLIPILIVIGSLFKVAKSKSGICRRAPAGSGAQRAGEVLAGLLGGLQTCRADGDQHRIGHVFFGETEVLEQHGRRGRFTVGVDAHHGSAAVFPPAVGHAHFHGHAGHAGGQHAALVLGVFTVEGGGAGHGDHAHADLLVGQQALGLEGQLYFRPGGDDHGHGLLLDAHVGGLAQHVGAARDVAQVALGRIGQVLARQGQHGGLVSVGQGHAPGHGGFGRVTLAPFAASVLTTLPCMSKRRLGVLLVLVRLEPVRSALPPSSSGRAAVKASSASWLALRLATVSPLVWAATTVSTATWAKLAGRSPFMRRVSSAASSGKAAV